MSETQHFGRIVREHRERLGLTLEEAAEQCKMSGKALGSIELGDSNPKLSHVLRIADVLQMDIGILNSCISILA